MADAPRVRSLHFVLKLPVSLFCSVETCTSELTLDGLPLEVAPDGQILFDGRTLVNALRNTPEAVGWVVGTRMPGVLQVPGVDQSPQIMRLALCPDHRPQRQE